MACWDTGVPVNKQQEDVSLLPRDGMDLDLDPRRLSEAQGQQHLMALGGWRNFSSACFSSKSFSMAFSACLFSSDAPMCCSSSAVDFCCASSLPVISCSGHSARTQPAGPRGSAPWSKRGFRGLGRRAPR